MKLLRNPIVVGTLAVVAMGVVLYQIIAPRWQAGASAEAPPPGVVPVQAPAAARVASAADKPATSPPGTVAVIWPATPINREDIEMRFESWVTSPARDPFLLLCAEAADAAPDTNSPVANWKLKAIWNQTGGRVAVINKGVYREGDQIHEGYKVEQIAGEEVWLQGPRRRERLGLEKPQPKTLDPTHQSPLAARP